MSDINIGDKVYLRKDLKVYDVHDALKVLPMMISDAKASTLFIVDEKCLYGHFHVKSCENEYGWYVTEDMITKEEGDKEMKEFTKADLKDGMVVETREHGRYLVLAGGLINRCVSFNLNYMYGDDLKDKTGDDDSYSYDIIKVFESKVLFYPGNLYEIRDFVENEDNFKLVWNRDLETDEEEPFVPVISKMGKNFLELLLASGHKWLARDNEGKVNATLHNGLYSYTEKPRKGVDICKWHSDGTFAKIYNNFDEFDFIKVDDVDPWNIEGILETCEVK